MSSIYIQEPPTHGKVLLRTSFGDLDIALWSRETPKACRNFVQLCMEGFYDGIIFHRVEKNFIAQTGDPTGTGCTSVSVYGEPFKDEIHSRIRFNRRGLVALANNGKDDNGSQFFITLGSTPELQGKHTIFGKLVGDTQYNITKLNDMMVDQDDKPIYETKIIKTKVLDNPFTNIVPRVLNVPKETETKAKEEKKSKKEKGVKNYKLLSFGEEAEEDELETLEETKKFEGKSKSTHDVLDDPKLSSQTILDVETTKEPEIDRELIDKQVQNVKSKLRGKSKEEKEKPQHDLEGDNFFALQREEEKNDRLKSIRNEIKNLKREYHKEQMAKTKETDIKKKNEDDKSELLKELEKEKLKYVDLKEKLSVKGAAREDFTLSLLKGFTDKLNSVRSQPTASSDANQSSSQDLDDEDNPSIDKWLNTQLECDTNDSLAKDANTKSDDWYEIYDPRNPINKRRRETSKQQITEKRRKKFEILIRAVSSGDSPTHRVLRRNKGQNFDDNSSSGKFVQHSEVLKDKLIKLVAAFRVNVDMLPPAGIMYSFHETMPTSLEAPNVREEQSSLIDNDSNLLSVSGKFQDSTDKLCSMFPCDVIDSKKGNTEC